MEFIIGENQGSFLLSETIFWQESVAECKLSSPKKRKAEWRKYFWTGSSQQIIHTKNGTQFQFGF